MIAAEAFAPTEAFSTGSDRAEPSDRTLLAAGLSLLRRHETVAAKRLLLYGCRLAPASADAWHALGLALVRNGEFGDAEAAFAEAERLGCSTVELALARVNAAVRAGTADAELDRLAVRSLADPFDAVALTARGVLLSRLGRGAEGIDLLEAAVALAPSEVGPAIELANALMHTDRTREAEASLARAIALAPRQWMLRNNRAVILMRSQRFEEARDELQALITANGEEPGLLCNLSNVLNALGEQDAGVSTARRATELVPDMHLAWRSLLNALAYRSGVDGATMRQTAERASECILR
ncbi:MAG TPA: tetratricopeptide repeat protein, partial [Acetobacteraceae bacterium]|nr:tetratricopeptide repeat protein [Acetobacteraceae bacterium]